MATAISIGFSVGDVVFVAYPISTSDYFTPKSRTVSKISVIGASDVAVISFSDGNQVNHSTATPTVYLTEALCATAIITDVISRSAATVVLEGGANTTLVRTV